VRNDEVLMRVERAGDALATQRRRRSGAYLRNTGFDGCHRNLCSLRLSCVLKLELGVCILPNVQHRDQGVNDWSRS
jgi:hypothetical protein